MLVRIDPFLPLTVPSIPISSNCFFSRQRDLLKSVHHLEAALVFRRKCRIARPVDHQRLHASRDRSLDLLDIVAEEEDSSGLKLEKESTCQHHIYSLTFAEEKQKKKKTHLQRLRNPVITPPLSLQPSINSIKPTPRNKPLQILRNLLPTFHLLPSPNMPHQQLLRKNTPATINRHSLSLRPPTPQRRDDIAEQRRRVGAAGVAVFPEVALQVLEVGDFDVAGGEVADVRFEGCWGGGVFGREGGAVGVEGGGVPLGGEDGGEGGEGVGELW
jgi:hypothetical protein